MYDIVPPDILAKTWVLFHQTSDAVYRASSKRLRPAGVSLEQARVLFVLSRSSSPPTRTEISRVVMRKPHTITALLQGMQRAGLIARIKDDRNKKLVRVVMTQKGKEAWKRVVQSELATELTASLSNEEFCQLSSILEKLRDAALRELEAGSVSGGN
jgi:DNA-binding MarR family transcriptional regulator